MISKQVLGVFQKEDGDSIRGWILVW